ncbi:S8 family serine peptidase [Embleya scabrispora]|uniref:S8 family serine peptidase n=1 Tax=Embleya scabrispora TaxID=159449 RepID=UPI00131A0BAB|nr:S8 family serine peptidase [Embleya scabrispora]MYS87173.1 S8 family serine peptidase [Streptomyces sp. SID5474]
MRAQQWYLDVWKIDEVWKLARGAGVTVAVIDGGVDATHPDLVGQVQSSLNSPGDSDGHGTGMASLIAGQGQAGGGQGVYGVAPEAKILPFRSARTPSGKMDPISTAKGIRLAADSSARIINLSIGGSAGNPVEREAISYALSKGKLVVAAGGNSPEDVNDQPVYPASYPGVLAISALSREGKPASNSIRGPWISLSAPGEEIPHACTTSTRYCKGVGSSDATALTSGVAALVWSVHPDWTANQVIRRLIDTANRPNEPVPSDTFGYGAVSPRKALAATDTPGPADVNPLIGVRGDKPAPATTAPSTSPSAAASAPAAPAGTAPPAATADKSGDDDNLLVPILVGTIAAAALVAGATVITMRRRRARELARRQAAAAPPWPTAPPTYHPGGGPYDRR